MTYGNEHVERMIIRGTQPEYSAAIPLFTVATGRYISPFDEEHARDVVVIGNAIADALFPHADPLGKTVRLNGQLYEVIGVFEKDPGLFGGFGVDQFACIPLSNFHKHYPEIREMWLIFAVRDDADLDVVRNTAVELMRRRRHVPHNAENDFEVADPNFFTDSLESAHGRDGAAHRRDQLDRAAGGRHRRDEHHADLGYGADGRDRHPQSDRRPQIGHPRAVLVGGGDAVRASAAFAGC